MKPREINILVVDDEPNTSRFIAQVLSTRQWRVDTACDGPTALDLARRTRYDAAVLDFRMPGMNGDELCRRLRELLPDLREIFLTGYPTIDTVYPAIEAGGQRVLAKPVDPQELISALEEQLV